MTTLNHTIMRIKLITSELHEELVGIFVKHPNLTYENKGSDCPNRSKWSDEDNQAFERVEGILKEHITGFEKFNNFRDRGQRVQLRFQYDWEADSEPGTSRLGHFSGVGYLHLDELLNGFDRKKSF